MSKRRDVLLAVKGLAAAAIAAGGYPAADIVGFDKEGSGDIRAGRGGTLAGWPGELEEVGATLSPLTHHYRHRIPMQVIAPAGAADPAAAIDAMLGAIGAAVVANRSMNGMVDFLEAEPPEEWDRTPENSVTTRSATFALIAEYSTTDPLN